MGREVRRWGRQRPQDARPEGTDMRQNGGGMEATPRFLWERRGPLPKWTQGGADVGGKMD